MKYNKKNYNKGYAILFTVIIVSIISMISIGMSNTAFKQIILSSVARDSTAAFYLADIASECALYADSEYSMAVPTNPWSCAGNTLDYSSPLLNSYELLPTAEDSISSNKCFRISVEKTETASLVATKIMAKGYNICNQDNDRTVERAIEINY